jgi:uncharacterized protein (UPF0332 family)
VLFDWTEFLELAKSLVGQSNRGYSQEAADRSAVSRAYYAAFCCARNYAEAQLGFKRKETAMDHRALCDFLKNQGKVQVAADLTRLRQWRNDCDYEDQGPNIRAIVVSALSTASQIVAACI